MSVSWPQCGHTNPLIFSIIPRIGILTFLAKFIAFFASRRATSCGVITMTIPSASGISWQILKGSSPVPGGRSMTSKSLSVHEVSSRNC